MNVKLKVICGVIDSVHSGGSDLVGVKEGTEGLGVDVGGTECVAVVVNDSMSDRVIVTPSDTECECVGVPEADPDLVLLYVRVVVSVSV